MVGPLVGAVSNLTWDFALFVGGFVGVLFLLAAGMVYLVAPGGPVAGGFALGLVALGAAFFALGVVAAVVLWWLADRD